MFEPEAIYEDTKQPKIETCQYALGTDGFVYTSCGQTRFPDVVNNYTYCPDCGRKVDLQGEGDS